MLRRRLPKGLATVAFVLVVGAFQSCGGGCGGAPTAPAAPAATPVPAAVTQNFFCVAFDIATGEGQEFDVQLPAKEALRGVEDWNVTATNVDLYFGYWGCPNWRAMVDGGCAVLSRDISAAKPAQFTQNILDNDLRVDPGKPRAKVVYAYNASGTRTQGIIQLSLTTNGPAPTSGALRARWFLPRRPARRLVRPAEVAAGAEEVVPARATEHRRPTRAGSAAARGPLPRAATTASGAAPKTVPVRARGTAGSTVSSALARCVETAPRTGHTRCFATCSARSRAS